MRNSRTVNIVIHIIIWSIFIFIPLFVLPEPSKYIKHNDYQLVSYIALTLFSILFFYFNFYQALPKLFFKRKYAQYILLIIVFFTITVLITGVIVSFFKSENNINYRESMLVKSHLIRFFIIFTVSVVLSYREKYKQIEKEKIKAELSVLKAKINPHFLFNTLNGIYAQALTMSDNTAGSIAKLSSIMRYSLTETDEDRVSLEKEIDYLKNYIELQKLRLTDKTNVIFEVKGITTSKQIAPMLFIHFIENAFKYGISNEEETQIKISISIENDDLSFTVFNNKVTNTNNQDSTKLGIKDTKHRLELIYPNRYFLDIFDDNKSFEVKLKIKDL